MRKKVMALALLIAACGGDGGAGGGGGEVDSVGGGGGDAPCDSLITNTCFDGDFVVGFCRGGIAYSTCRATLGGDVFEASEENTQCVVSAGKGSPLKAIYTFGNVYPGGMAWLRVTENGETVRTQTATCVQESADAGT